MAFAPGVVAFGTTETLPDQAGTVVDVNVLLPADTRMQERGNPLPTPLGVSSMIDQAIGSHLTRGATTSVLECDRAFFASQN
jgi:hypothetical protein